MTFCDILPPKDKKRSPEVGSDNPSLWKTCFTYSDSTTDTKRQEMALCYAASLRQKVDGENPFDSVLSVEMTLKALD